MGRNPCRADTLASMRTLELDDHTAVQADEMLMDRLRREAVFIPLEALSEVELSHELTSYEKIQGPIDRRLANSVTVRSEHALDLVHRKVLARSKHDLRHRLPLTGYWQSLLSQVASEESDEGGRVRACLHVTTGSNKSASNSSNNALSFSESPAISTTRGSPRSISLLRTTPRIT